MFEVLKLDREKEREREIEATNSDIQKKNTIKWKTF